MHRSRIGVVLIDHPDASYDAALTFWGAVRGIEPQQEEHGPYASLGVIGNLQLDLQRLVDADRPRVHLDVETDDLPAEVARLVGLGAEVLEERDGYQILTDPGGLVFCVVPVQTGAIFEGEATTWE